MLAYTHYTFANPSTSPWYAGDNFHTTDAQYDKTCVDALHNSYHDKQGGWNTTAVRTWVRWKMARGRDPLAVWPADAPLAQRMEDYNDFVRFHIWLVCYKEPGVQPSTASSYGSTVQGFLDRTVGSKLFTQEFSTRLKYLLKGLWALRGGKPLPKKRKPMSADKLAEAFRFLDRNKPEHANVRAALATGLQMLLRGSEIGRGDRKTWKQAFNLARGDLHFERRRNSDGSFIEDLTALLSPAKKNIRSTKCVPVTVGGGGYFIDAVAEMRNLERVDPVTGTANRAATPAFRNKHGIALSVSEISKWIKYLMKMIGEDPQDYSSHSLRIGGASILYKANASDAIIMTMGRWDSNCFIEYVRADKEAARTWTSCIGNGQLEPESDFRELEMTDIACEEDDDELDMEF